MYVSYGIVLSQQSNYFGNVHDDSAFVRGQFAAVISPVLLVVEGADGFFDLGLDGRGAYVSDEQEPTAAAARSAGVGASDHQTQGIALTRLRCACYILNKKYAHIEINQYNRRGIDAAV